MMQPTGTDAPRQTVARRPATAVILLLLAVALAGCSAGSTGCDEFLVQSPDEQRQTVRRALDQREMWTPSLDGVTREMAFLCALDRSANLTQVMNRAGVADESSIFRGWSLLWIGLVLAGGGTIAAKVMDNQRPNNAVSGEPSSSPSETPLPDPPSPTKVVLERDPRLAQALEHGAVHYRVMWLITKRPRIDRAALNAASKDTSTEVRQALDDLATAGLVRMLPNGTITTTEIAPGA